jgi:hypothetical protein
MAPGGNGRRSESVAQRPARTLVESAGMKTFADFWPYYLGEHRNPLNRLLHVVGSTAGLALVALAVWRQQWALVPAGIVCGYAFAWIGHFVVERNKPATFQHPLWSFVGDWKMYGLMVTGRLPAELSRLEPVKARA